MVNKLENAVVVVFRTFCVLLDISLNIKRPNNSESKVLGAVTSGVSKTIFMKMAWRKPIDGMSDT